MKILLLLLLFVTGFSDGGKKGRDANKAYEQGNYAKAEQEYRAALKSNPNNPKLLFNLGNSLARQKKFDQALSTYDQFKKLVNDPSEKAKADYNMGNVYAEQKKWSQALSMYRHSLLSNPNDPQTKYNYELAYHQQKQQQKKQQQQQNKNNQNKNKNKNKQNQNQNQNKKNKQNQNQNKSPQNQGNKDQDKQKQQPKPDPNKMSKSDADKILSALENQEKNLLKNFKKAKTQSTKKNAKDW